MSTIDEYLEKSKAAIERAVTQPSWNDQSTTALVDAVARHQVVLEEVWERFSKLVLLLVPPAEGG